MSKQVLNLIENIKEEIKNFRLAFINLKEHRHNKFYKNKFYNASKDLNKIKLKISQERTLLKDKNLSLIKDKIEILLKTQNNQQKEEILEEIEDSLDGLDGSKNKDDVNIKEKFYDKGEQYDFYSDVKDMVTNAKQRIFIVDSYLDGDLLDIYLKKMPLDVELKILTNSDNPKGNFPKIARMFAKKHKATFETRESPFCHDRAIFIDEHGWVIGQSIKDLAKNKPSYLRKLDSPAKLEKFFKSLWNNSKKVV